MCGIVGFITEEQHYKGSQDRKKFLAQALLIDTLRGDDSTGVFYSSRTKSEDIAGYYKSTDHGADFIDREEYFKIATRTDTFRFMVGHNRAATVGGITVDGAHPFQEGAVTLVHNGTLRSTHGLPKSQTELAVDVDSHALCHNLALATPDEAGDVISKINGAFALVWHDARDGSMNIVRNGERPLHMAKSLIQDTVYFASEAGQLKYLDDRLTLGLDDIMYPEPGLFMKFLKGSLAPVVKKVELFVPPKGYASGYGYGWGDDDWTGGGYDRATVETVNSPKPYTPPQENRVLVGGRRQDIPNAVQLAMLDQDLMVEDRMVMTPIEITPKRKKDKSSLESALVLGHIDTLGVTAVLHNVTLTSANAASTNRWLVRPIALKYTRKDRSEYIVICKVVSLYANKADETVAKRIEPTDPETDDQAPSAIGGYMGPGGQYISKDEWMKATELGCAMCGHHIHITAARDIDWYDEEFPLCIPCTVHRRDNPEEELLPWVE